MTTLPSPAAARQRPVRRAAPGGNDEGTYPIADRLTLDGTEFADNQTPPPDNVVVNCLIFMP
ncbi:hypothetical protein SSCG_01095 [Streptomyces clavuligerus]|nr:hypothetical protein SSCG_01095 [Streptomyces clavuligerus]